MRNQILNSLIINSMIIHQDKSPPYISAATNFLIARKFLRIRLPNITQNIQLNLAPVLPENFDLLLDSKF